MNSGLKLASLVALVATIFPGALYLADSLSLQTVKWMALAGTIVWFVATPLWMGTEVRPDADQVEI